MRFTPVCVLSPLRGLGKWALSSAFAKARSIGAKCNRHGALEGEMTQKADKPGGCGRVNGR